MKRVRVRSMEDLRALPEGEWVEVIGPMKWNVPEKTTITTKGRSVVVDLPGRMKDELPFEEGEKLEASIRKNTLVVRRPTRRNGRRKSAG